MVCCLLRRMPINAELNKILEVVASLFWKKLGMSVAEKVFNSNTTTHPHNTEVKQINSES